jgi:alpha-1,3-rhamnosyl/mannosyltransferase
MTRRRHIVLDATAARPPLTGVGWSMVELINALAEAPGEFHFTILTGHPELFRTAVRRAECSLQVVPAGGGWLSRVWMMQRTVPLMAQRLDADILHVLTMPGPSRSSCPVVLTIHDVAFLHVPGSIGHLRRWWYRAALPAGLKQADLILTNSNATARELEQAYPVEATSIRTTPFATPAWVRNRPVADLPRGDQAPFLFIGTLEPRKNLIRILQAVEMLHKQAKRTEEKPVHPLLHVVGAQGWRNQPILDRLRVMEQQGLIVLESHQSRDVLWQRLISARGLLLPSLHEGFGFPILEAMAAGIPVITSDRGAMREVAGEAAILVNPEDPAAIAQAMSRIMTEPDLVSSLRDQGLIRSRQFDWGQTAALTLDAYRWILSRR